MKVFKYEFTPDKNYVNLPPGAEILSAAMQDSCFCIWALVDDTDVVKQTRELFVVGTGWEIDLEPENLGFILTVSSDDQVFHIFERV